MIWPSHRIETRSWNPRQRQGSRDDRTLESIEVSIPPMIASLEYDAVGAGQTTWAVTDVLAELDALSAAIGKRTTDHV